MCGIAGYMTISENRPDIKCMTSSLAHRGPDAQGLFHSDDGKAGFGHRRLSVIDTNHRSNQPFHSYCDRYVISYNGEIYNYQELKQEILESKPINFKTTSDTEVLLEGFVLWGPEVANKLNGMFAFSIYDKVEKKIWLFRDRIGIKPLFVYHQNGLIAWSSELKTFQIEPQISKDLTLNHEAIHHYLHLGYIPQPLTIYHQIEKFPSSTWRCINEDLTYQDKCYWDVKDQFDVSFGSEEDLCDRLKNLLESSVRYRLISDVPFGTLLSGGVDSSLVTAIAAGQSREKLKTFSVGLEDKKYDESGFARNIADYLHTDHHELVVTEEESLALVVDIINTWDEPFADSSAIPTMVISKMASQEVKMVLSGDGGDELFHGYGAYDWANRLERPIIKMLSPIIGGLLRFTSNDRNQRASHLFDQVKDDHVRSHIFSQEQYLFSQKELRNLLIEKSNSFSYNDPNLDRSLTPAERQALFDLQYYLKDDLLVKVDRASMRFSLEDRVPLLDHRLVEFAMNVPPHLKLFGQSRKYLLQKVLFEYLPEKFFDRPKKGFSVPLVRWLKTDLRPWLEENLDKDTIEKAGIVKYDEVIRLKNAFFQGKDYLYNRLWSLAILHQWFRQKN